MLRVTRAIEFSSSLRYGLPELDAEANRERFGAQAAQHGHNYRLEITVRGEADPQTGMVINLRDIKSVAEEEIMARFDHKDLNADTDFFEKIPPTPENFARVIFDLLEAALPPGMLDRVRLYQEPDLYVDVLADRLAGAPSPEGGADA